MSRRFNITGLPLRINQFFYQIKQNDSFLIVESLSNLTLPANPEDGKVILIVNVSEELLVLNSNDNTNQIYNNLYAPNGSFEIEIDANRTVYLMYIVNITSNEGRWLAQVG